ncbi:DUF3089 domain-containing protein [Sphingobium sufflavum]|uniref:DUF3089 domain-containing protein n=1 Tax=Sphingobium sufflavum TaxID=1129547 RepID=UPI001F1D14CE|nr:DUF3089 domain-containing protein [Sphingobium sufflavum]MCE7796480.1 DUF3089 domain-containing protein [Sphingobium sufflavum]
MRGALGSIARLALPLLTAAAPIGFDQSNHPAAPDYARANSWMMRGIDDAADKPADLFYIQPTTFRSKDWNQDMADAATNHWTDISVGARQVSAFADCCRRFAPRYRQASTGTFSSTSGDREQAYALAYQDVRSAFRAFLAVRGKEDRPFILAGHSQGALHGLRLLEEEIAGTPLARQLIAAYLPGIGIPGDALPSSIPVCATPRQAGCIVSWNSFTATADTSGYIARSHAAHGTEAGTAPLLCVNPLTFSIARPKAGYGAAKGALPGPAIEGPMPSPQPKAVAAYCDGNVLRVTPRPGLAVELLPGGSAHMADIALFWADIRANTLVRVRAFHNQGSKQ